MSGDSSGLVASHSQNQGPPAHRRGGQLKPWELVAMMDGQGPIAELFPARFNGQEIQLLCPICGFDYVRLVKVEVGPAGKAMQHATIDADGVSTHPRGGAAGLGRGNTLTLTFHCESGHEFRRSFSFHKGQTTLECSGGEIPDGGDVKQTLWRD